MPVSAGGTTSFGPTGLPSPPPLSACVETAGGGVLGGGSFAGRSAADPETSTPPHARPSDSHRRVEAGVVRRDRQLAARLRRRCREARVREGAAQLGCDLRRGLGDVGRVAREEDDVDGGARVDGDAQRLRARLDRQRVRDRCGAHRRAFDRGRERPRQARDDELRRGEDIERVARVLRRHREVEVRLLRALHGRVRPRVERLVGDDEVEEVVGIRGAGPVGRDVHADAAVPVRPLPLALRGQGEDVGAARQRLLERRRGSGRAGAEDANDDRLRAAVGEEVLHGVPHRLRVVDRRPEQPDVVGEAEHALRAVDRARRGGADERRHRRAHADDRVHARRALLDVHAWVRGLHGHLNGLQCGREEPPLLAVRVGFDPTRGPSQPRLGGAAVASRTRHCRVTQTSRTSPRTHARRIRR